MAGVGYGVPLAEVVGVSAAAPAYPLPLGVAEGVRGLVEHEGRVYVAVDPPGVSSTDGLFVLFREGLALHVDDATGVGADEGLPALDIAGVVRALGLSFG